VSKTFSEAGKLAFRLRADGQRRVSYFSFPLSVQRSPDHCSAAGRRSDFTSTPLTSAVTGRSLSHHQHRRRVVSVSKILPRKVKTFNGRSKPIKTNSARVKSCGGFTTGLKWVRRKISFQGRFQIKIYMMIGRSVRCAIVRGEYS
jgi:hypothetical protein